MKTSLTSTEKIKKMEPKLKKFLSESDIKRFKESYEVIKMNGVHINKKIIAYNEFQAIVRLVKRRAAIKSVKIK